MKIVVLGGAGKMGCLAVEDLVLNPRVDEVISGRPGYGNGGGHCRLS